MTQRDPLDGYRGFESSRIRQIESRERWRVYSGDPNGVLAAGLSTYCWDYVNNDLYVNNDGATGWTFLGGGSGAIPHNLLNGVVHPDTALQGVSRGSLVYGDSTPLWNELVHPAATNRVLITDANDVLWSLWSIIGTSGAAYTMPPVTSNIVGFNTTQNTGRLTKWSGNPQLILSSQLVDAISGGLINLFATLTTNRTFTFPDTSGVFALGSGIANSVAYWQDANTLDADSLFVWLSNRLGVGVASPQGKLHVVGTSQFEMLVEALAGNPDFSWAVSGDIKAQVKYDLSDVGMAFLVNSANTGYTAITDAFTALFLDAATRNVGVGHVNPDRALHVEESDTTTDATTFVMRMSHIIDAGSTAQADVGVGAEWELERATGANQIVATDEAKFSDVGASWKGKRIINVFDSGGSREVMRAIATGTQAFVGVGGLDAVGGSSDPHSTLQSGGSVAAEDRTATAASVELGDRDTSVNVDATSNNITVALPTAAGIQGRRYEITRVDDGSSGNTVTIDPSGSETIGPDTTFDLYAYESIAIRSDGTNWQAK